MGRDDYTDIGGTGEAFLTTHWSLIEGAGSGEETRVVLSVNNAPDYRVKLNAELEAMRNTEMWQAGAAVRALRPENRRK